ncbi:MAG TPA: hypothetical protein PKC93_18005, partial [Candidatus Obscuribacter sp.]|nr:hypothetical protein [Candidatus Obscuribacter sp.]
KRHSVLSVLPGLFCLTLAFTPLVSPPSAWSDDNGWVEGDTEEMRERPSSRRRPQTQPNSYQDQGEAVPEAEGGRPQSRRKTGSSGSENFTEGDAGAGQAQPGAAAESANPVLQIKSGSNTLTGGISSSTYRRFERNNRGLDKMGSRFLQQSPYLEPPRTIAVQPSTFKNWLEQYHAGIAAAFSKTTIIEVKGQWDDAGHILRGYGLPFTRITSNKLKETDLAQTRILVVNCGANLDAGAVQRVRDFVSGGGYLLTTDWALDSCLEKAFPGYVEWNSDYTESSIVDAVVVDEDPVLLVGVPRVAYWKLENRSQTVKVLRGREVQVLARSRDLMQRECSNLGILALTFPYGAGRVLHLVGHFDNNADRAFNNALPDPAPIIGIGLRQAIAGNFLVAALSGDAKVPPAPEN